MHVHVCALVLVTALQLAGSRLRASSGCCQSFTSMHLVCYSSQIAFVAIAGMQTAAIISICDEAIALATDNVIRQGS